MAAPTRKFGYYDDDEPVFAWVRKGTLTRRAQLRGAAHGLR